MDLQNFVASTLIQIVNGIKDAQKELVDTGALVNPGHAQAPGQSGRAAMRDQGTWNEIQNITFDVAITVAQGDETGGGLGIKVLAAQLGGSRVSTREASAVSRVQFIVPLSLPIATRPASDAR